MKARVRHVSALRFDGTIRGHSHVMDVANVPGATDTGPSPKELLLSSILGCSGMDVASLLKKNRVEFRSLELSADAETTSTYPKVFKRIDVVYDLEGEALPLDKVKEAVELSMTKYCGVSAMVSKVSPIHYVIRINGEEMARGQARFEV